MKYALFFTPENIRLLIKAIIVTQRAHANLKIRLSVMGENTPLDVRQDLEEKLAASEELEGHLVNFIDAVKSNRRLITDVLNQIESRYLKVHETIIIFPEQKNKSKEDFINYYNSCEVATLLNHLFEIVQEKLHEKRDKSADPDVSVLDFDKHTYLTLKLLVVKLDVKFVNDFFNAFQRTYHPDHIEDEWEKPYRLALFNARHERLSKTEEASSVSAPSPESSSEVDTVSENMSALKL